MRGCRLLIAVALFSCMGVSACASRTTTDVRADQTARSEQRPGDVAAHSSGAARTSLDSPAADAGTRPARDAEPRQRRRVSYRLQIGDEMDVSFYKTPELNTHVKIRPDGNITVPFLGDVRAVDIEPGELAAVLEQRYAGELRAPRITVNVTQSAGQRIYVGGEVGQPGMLQLTGPVTALQAIQQAGGFKESASLSSIVLIRRSGGRAQGTEVDLSDVVSGEDPDVDPFLQAYDIVFVPRSPIADVDLFVDQYIRKILPMNPSFGIGLGTF